MLSVLFTYTIFCECVFDHCLPVCPFPWGHCIACPSSIVGFWIPTWYLQTFLPYTYILQPRLPTTNTWCGILAFTTLSLNILIAPHPYIIKLVTLYLVTLTFYATLLLPKLSKYRETKFFLALESIFIFVDLVVQIMPGKIYLWLKITVPK
jgi:hypothetical protein